MKNYIKKSFNRIFIMVVFIYASYAAAGTDEFLDYIGSLGTDEEKAVACYRVYSILNTVGELRLHDVKTEGERRKQYNVIFQGKIRLQFLELLASNFRLVNVRDKAFSLGQGMDIVKSKGRLSSVCVEGVNKVLNDLKYKKLADKAVAISRKYIADLERNISNDRESASSREILQQELNEIVRMTGRTDGKLSREMHKEFWLKMSKLGSSEDISSLEHLMRKNTLVAYEYQMEVWKSVKLSKENGQVVRTDRLVELSDAQVENFKINLPYQPGTKKYIEAVSAYEQSIKPANMNRELLLSAAAENKDKVTTAQGKVVDLSTATINFILNNIDESFARLKKLFNKEWIEDD